MVMELGSVRALAPTFGASTEVWTSAIGIVLVALAAGYAVGGVLAVRARPARTLGLALTLSGALAAMAPWLLRPLASWLVPEDLSLEHAATILRTGALFTQGTLFGLPVFLAAMASPILVRILSDRGYPAGRAAGLVLFASTLGGLVGTFGTTYWLVPFCGIRTTLYGTGLGLALLGTATLAFDRRAKEVAAGLAAALGAAGWGFGALEGPLKPAAGGERLLAEIETREQYARAIERSVVEPDGRAGREVWLQINEGLDSFQSLDAPDRTTPGHYYDVLAFVTLLAGNVENPNVLMIGSGAGSTARSLLSLAPRSTITAIELDPGVVALGREHMRLKDLEARGVRVVEGIDGRVAIGSLRERYDAILIDAYARQVEIPFHLVTLEMGLQCLGLLNEHGVLAINVSSFGREDPVLGAIADTLSAAAERAGLATSAAAVIPVRRDHNSIVAVRKGAGGWPTSDRFLTWLRTQTSLPALAMNLAQFVCSPGGIWLRKPRIDGTILTDDLAPMEWLQGESLRLATRGWRR